MKESIGGTQLFIIVVTLILIFAGIMALTINHSNAFAVKDQVVTIIEKYNGFDMTTDLAYESQVKTTAEEELQEIVDSLANNSYRQTGKCPEGDENIIVSAYGRDGRKTSGNNLSSFCIVRTPANKASGTIGGYYYKVVVFYSLDLPVLRTLINLKAVGETKILYN